LAVWDFGIQLLEKKHLDSLEILNGGEQPDMCFLIYAWGFIGPHKSGNLTDHHTSSASCFREKKMEKCPAMPSMDNQSSILRKSVA
jgi:hypothetical protein